LKLFDSKNNKIKNLILDPKKTINIYECGPTVYDHIHLGNLRPILIVDIIINYLKFKNIKFNYLLNITDIDDKIILKAQNENKSEASISSYYLEQFLTILKKLNLNPPTSILQVTNHLNNLKKDLNSLLDQKVAYYKADGIYFEIKKFPKYNQISKNNQFALISQENKDSFDFALWKKTNKGLNWNYNSILGRPGWHLECASFISNYFKDTINLHLGGVDLKFPHHENERAIFYFLQPQKEIANIFFHNGHVFIKKLKMSKSLQNCIYVKDFLKIYDFNVIKYLFLLNSPLKPLNFNEDVFKFANKEIIKIKNLALKLNAIKIEKFKIEEFKNNQFLEQFLYFLENNLNFPNALMVLNKLIKTINTKLKQKIVVKSLNYQFKQILKLLGFKFN